MTKVAKRYGMSDVAIRKDCKKLNIDSAGNIKPDKENSTKRIGAVALIMASDRALRHQKGGCIYEKRGFLIL